MCVQTHIESARKEEYNANNMRMSNAFSLALGTVLLVGLSNPPGSIAATPLYAPLVAGNTDFALSLLGQLEATNSGNIFFSPYSISACFGMVYDGARGETALQMAEALDLSTNQAEVGPEYGALQAELVTQAGQNGISLSVANGLWAQTNFSFLPAFLDNADTNYDASVQQVDFTTDALQITGQINEWVADQTDGMIPNLLQPGTLNPYTRLALVDAIYFNGGWQTIFDTNLTTSAPFYVSPTQFVYAPLMEQFETARYYEDNLLQAVELPYLNSNLTMVVLLPKINGPAALTSAELSAALDGLAPRWMDVILPKFNLDMTINLVPILENMGMVDAFSPDAADFSGMSVAGGLSIASATHEAVVEVNETGTVAAGATVITIVISAITIPTLFQADHPFVFLIRDTNSASILFLGRVGDPTAGSAPRATTSLPLIQTTGGSFGLRNHQFGFNVTSTNATLVVEACTNLTRGAWFPIRTLTLTNGSAYFSEPLPPNSPSRFYRVQQP
jgi:serpin B